MAELACPVVVELSSELRALASTCRILPRSVEFSSIHVWLGDLDEDDPLERAINRQFMGDVHGAWALARPLIGSHGGTAAVVGAALALAAGDADSAIAALEALLAGPTVREDAGSVILPVSDGGMLVFEVNSLAGIALLVHAYAQAGRRAEAIELAVRGYDAVGAQALLVLKLLLLRDGERWGELLGAAEDGDPYDDEVRLLRGQALEETGRHAEALRLYLDIASDDMDLTWINEARRRADRLITVVDPAEVDTGDVGDQQRYDAVLYDPLNAVSLPPDQRSGPSPEGGAPAITLAARVRHVDLSLGGYLDGRVWAYPMRAPEKWLASFDEGPPEAWLDRLDAAIAIAPRTVGLRRRPDPDQVAAKRWQRVLAALLSAAATRDEATRRLADVLAARDSRIVVEGLGDWWDAHIDVTIGELCLNTSGGPDSIVLALVARQHAAGEITAARQWVRWAMSSGSTEALRLADVALAFSARDDAHVLTATDGLSDRDAATVVLQTYRARALQRTRCLEPAILVLTEALTLTRKLGDEHAGLVVPVRYLRARALLAASRTAEAVRDLHAVQADEAHYLDVADVLGAVTASEPRRRREDRRARTA